MIDDIDTIWWVIITGIAVFVLCLLIVGIIELIIKLYEWLSKKRGRGI